jgi:ADP-ribose pyrophosphatase
MFKRIKKELAYKAHIFDVYNDYLEMPDGKEVVYDLIDHVDGACILPVYEDGSILLEKQYRNTLDRDTYEVPAGCMNDGENGKECALRELKEETGLMAKRCVFVTKTVLAIGTSNEQTYIYIGFDLEETKSSPDPEEFIELRRFTLEESMDMIRAGEIVDSKTIIAIYAYKAFDREALF